MSDSIEALIGAVFLDGGYEAAEGFVHQVILSDLEHKQLFFDSKTLLQEYAQRDSGAILGYTLVEEIGPDHDKEFIVEARLNGKVVGRGGGRTKKAAEQQAAYEALLAMQASE